ncbi:BRO-N domain-containing protein [Nocardia nova]|uniref:BRO-N domain-containing protein n=1 Tax=Nocardia nova TaxID=37330 RepID=UPI002B4B0CBF|nr:BRO family protein [Nocardia nova]
MTELMPFTYEGTPIRTVVVDGAPEFVAADVCRVLEHSNPSAATVGLDEDERGLRIVETPSGAQQMATVTEAGLYSLIIRSRKPEAKRFRRWITHEVIPAIRKTGGYGQAVERLTPLEYARQLVAAEERAELETARAEKAERRLVIEQKHRAAIEGGDGIDPTTFGKKYFSEVRKKDFETHLYERGWLIDQRNTRVRPDGSTADGYDHRKPTAKGRPYFYPHDNGTHGGRRRFAPRVRPQMEIALRDALAAEGLPVNQHSTGLVLLTDDEMKELEG